ncbi:hypothetical protein ATANTOWER_028861 [Ataeniobius toweri]|uniref:Uncharacterized protein n=1 Tax=Ataeniobius toweri TaxID=208326 RepID=A0ABU7ABW4_9TELE|nr:hypothetical protein [Ataeniobius toweri]
MPFSYSRSGYPGIPLCSIILQLNLGGAKGFPCPKEYRVTPEGSRTPQGFSPSEISLENFKVRLPDQMSVPPHMTSFDQEEQLLYLDFSPNIRAPHRNAQADPSHCKEQA